MLVSSRLEALWLQEMANGYCMRMGSVLLEVLEETKMWQKAHVDCQLDPIEHNPLSWLDDVPDLVVLALHLLY